MPNGKDELTLYQMWDQNLKDIGSNGEDTSREPFLPEGVSVPHYSTLPAQLKTAINLAHYRNILSPSKAEIFSAFYQFKPEQTKIVIVGNEPYLNKGMATGLAFGLPVKQSDYIPLILENIIKEAEDSLETSDLLAKTDLTLKSWAKQGVLLVNSCLTTCHLKSKAHQNIGWEQIVTEYFKQLDNLVRYKVYIGWGDEAQSLLSSVDNNQNLVLTGAHPLDTDRFLGCDHFAEANDYLERRGRGGIRW